MSEGYQKRIKDKFNWSGETEGKPMARGRERESFMTLKFRLLCSKGKSIQEYTGEWIPVRVNTQCFHSRVKKHKLWIISPQRFRLGPMSKKKKKT